MQLILIVTLLLVILLTAPGAVSTVVPCGEAVEEGSTYTVRCSTLNRACPTRPQVTWLLQNVGNPPSVISSCDLTLTCTGNNNDYSSNIKEVAGSYYSNLTVHDASVDRTNWVCLFCDDSTERCDVAVFVRPIKPQCQFTEINDQDGTLSSLNFTCTAERVYPRAECQFWYVQESANMVDLSQGNALCELLVDVRGLPLGTLSFEAGIKSNIQPDTFDEIEPIKLRQTIHLSLPTTEIQCPGSIFKDGYFKGDTVNCSCSLAHRGNPQGEAIWIPDDRAISARLAFREFSINMAGLDEGFNCSGTSKMGANPDPAQFFPKFAVLNNANLMIDSTDGGQPVNICCEQPGVNISCSIRSVDVLPAATFILLVNGKTWLGPVNGNLDDFLYTWTFNFLPSFGGVYSVGCRVENVIFADLAGEQYLNLTIFSPVELVENPAQSLSVDLGPESQETIRLYVTAFPKPNSTILYKGKPETNITYPQYDVEYVATAASHWTVEVTITNVSMSDLISHSIVVYNGIGEELIHEFTIEENDSGKSLDIIILVVSLVSAVVLVVIVVLAVLWWRRRHKKNASQVNNQDDNVGDKNKTKGKNDTEDDEDPYTMPEEGNEEENDYTLYNEGASAEAPAKDCPPSHQTPVPVPKAQGKAKLKKEPTPTKSKPGLSKNAHRTNAPNPAEKKDRTTKEKTKTETAAAINVGSKSSEATPGYYNVDSNAPKTDNGDDEEPPPRPPRRVVKSIYANMPDSQSSENDDDVAADSHGGEELHDYDAISTNNSVHDDFYTTINEGVEQSQRMMY